MSKGEKSMTNLYEMFVKNRSEEGKRNGSIKDLLPYDSVTRAAVLSDIIYRSLREVCGNSNTTVSVNENKCVFVYQDKTCGIVCEDGFLEAEKVTKLNCVLIAQLFPDTETILSDIRTEQLKRKPQLPESVLSIITKYHDWNLHLQSYTIERLVGLILGCKDKYLNPSSDRVINACNDAGKQLRNHIIKDKVVKDNLPTNTTAVIGEEIYKQTLKLIELKKDELVKVFNEWDL